MEISTPCCDFKRIKPFTILMLFEISLTFTAPSQATAIQLHRRFGKRGPFSVRFLHHGRHAMLGTRNRQLPNEKPHNLRMKAFLDKPVSSVEYNRMIMGNLVNCAKIRRIFDKLENRPPVYGSRSRVHVVPKWSSYEKNSQSIMDYKRKHRNQLYPVILQLRGPIIPEMSLTISPESFHNHCLISLHHVAVIIPYRNQKKHLVTLLNALHPILRRQQIHYRVYVVEQVGNNIFNKGVLMNAGVRESLRDDDFQCFVFYDVDLIPEDDRNLYTCPRMPRHMSVVVDKFNYTLPYDQLVGGVFSIQLDHFAKINGYSNLYFGWGGEDDDIAIRMAYRHLQVIRPPEFVGRYSMIKHRDRTVLPAAVRWELLRTARKRSPLDGLNTVKYRSVRLQDTPSYTHLYINIDSDQTVLL